MEQELRFGVVINWLNKLVKTSTGAEQFNAVLDGADHAEGLDIPRCVSETFPALPGEVNGIVVPDYISDLLIWAPTQTAEAAIPEYVLATFQVLWRRLLENEQCERLYVLEPACGSANDYRFIEVFGIARLLDYTGFDLCEKNIQNARQMFPNVRFEIGNVLEIDAPDNSFDCCFVHDLFEHLSSEAMEATIAEICRVTRQGICVGFFNMHEGDNHLVKTVDDYHWNNLSMSRTKATFERFVCEVQVIHIDTLLISQFGYDKTHNKGAYTFITKM